MTFYELRRPELMLKESGREGRRKERLFLGLLKTGLKWISKLIGDAHSRPRAELIQA